MTIDQLRAIMTVDDRLDDVTRARIWSRLDERIALHASRRRIGWRWPVAIAAAAAAAVAIALLRPTAEPDRRLLLAPPEVTLDAALGPYTQAALVGPARLEIEDARTVRLAQGTLYATFEGGRGRALRVVAPGIVVDVVGTLFAIEAGEHDSCVSVVHGKVRAASARRIAYVGAGERWCSAEPAGPITPQIREALTRHERVLAVRSEPQPQPQPQPEPSPEPQRQPEPQRRPEPEPQRRPEPEPPPPPRTARSLPLPLRLPLPSPKVLVSDEARTPEPPTPTPTPTPTAEPPAPAPAPAPAPVSADSLYREAEAALARRDGVSADRALAELVAKFPQSSLVDQALYERAQLAYRRRAWAEARRHLDELAQVPGTPLAEPGRYLACRIAVEARERDAERCLADFRTSFPRSAHDLDVLGLLVQLVHARSGCAGAEPHVAELARRYPASALAKAWRASCPEAR
jgi:hypothetical protein